MKKLLFLIVSMVVVGSVNAQTRAIKSVPNEAVQAPVPQKVEKEPVAYTTEVPSYLNDNTVLGNVPVFSVKKQKANYQWEGYYRSTQYATSVLTSEETAWGTSSNHSVYTLFPDSLAITHREFVDEPESSFDVAHYPAIGFTFDPYSKSYDSEFKNRLFQDDATGKIYSYRVDTLIICGEYRISDYNLENPDKLQVYISHHNPHNAPNYTGSEPNLGTEYFLLDYYARYGGYALTPIVEYEDRNNIAQKGSIVKPVAASTIMEEYILSPDDSAQLQVGYIGYRSMVIPVDNFEVPAGHVVTVLIKYIPGYDYNEGDTIRSQSANLSTNSWLTDDVIQNMFGVPVIVNRNFESFTDIGEGYNGRLMEDMNVRYDADSGTYKHGSTTPNFSNPNKYQAYKVNYYAIPYAWVGVSIDPSDLINEPPAWDPRPESVKEPNAVVSRIYPNPANDRVQIELINGGTAELSIMNALGQVVKVAAMNEISNTIDVSSLSPGIYMLKITQGGNVYTAKLTKN